MHQNPYVYDLLENCPGVGRYLDLEEGEHYIFGQVGALLRDGTLEPDIQGAAWRYLNCLGRGDLEARNLLVVNVLEILADTPASVALARKNLEGTTLELFERTLQGWPRD